MKTSHLELHTEPLTDGVLIEAHAHGTLDAADYDKLVPELNGILAEGRPVNFLLYLDDFHGWTADSFARELKWDATHRTGIRRVAVVGSAEWEKWVVRVAEGIVPGEVRYFDHAHAADAQTWARMAA